jgi:large subunit ribosomal protein L13
MKEYTIDATGNKIGRVASQAAVILMGKNDPSFEKHTVAPVKLTIINAGKIIIDPRKMEEMQYAMYSGYPGGLRYDSLEKVIEKKGIQEVIKRAVNGMLPKNKLQPLMMKNLTVKE